MCGISADKKASFDSLRRPETTFNPLTEIAPVGSVPSHTFDTSATSSTVAVRPVAAIAVTLW